MRRVYRWFPVLTVFTLLALVFILVANSKNSVVQAADTVFLCQKNTDCDDGIDFTNDTCEAPNTTDAICRHKMNRPTSMCAWYPQGSANATTGYINGNIDQKNLLDSVDILGHVPHDPIVTRTGNLLSDVGLITNSDLHKKGKLLLEHIGRTELAGACGISGVLGTDIAANQVSSCTSKMVDYLSATYLDKKESDGTPSVHGLNYDELYSAPDAQGFGNLYSAMAKAFYKVKQKYPYVSIYIWTSNNPIIEGDKIQVYVDLFKATDYRMKELYLDDSLSQEENARLLNEAISAWNAFFNKFNFNSNQRNLIMSANGMIESDTLWTYDLSSSVNYYHLLDYQLNFYKQKINSGEVDGIAIFHCNRGPEEQSVFKQLLDHYIYQDKNNRLYGTSVNNNFISNSSFETDTSWQLQAGTGGMIEYSVYDKNKILLNENNNFLKFSQVAAPEIPNGVKTYDGRRLYMQRGSSSNIASQPVSNLVSGKSYKLEIYSKKINGDFGKSGVKTKLVNKTSGADIDAQYEKMTFLNIVATYGTLTQYIYPFDYCQKYFTNYNKVSGAEKVPCNYQNNLWTKEEFIFKAPVNLSNLELQITDDEAVPGDANVADSVQLQEYHVPSVEIRADRTSASSGETITYTLEYHNYSNTDKTDVKLSAPIDERLNFVSASNSGNAVSGKVQWTVPKVKAGESLFYTYKAKVK